MAEQIDFKSLTPEQLSVARQVVEQAKQYGIDPNAALFNVYNLNQFESGIEPPPEGGTESKRILWEKTYAAVPPVPKEEPATESKLSPEEQAQIDYVTPAAVAGGAGAAYAASKAFPVEPKFVADERKIAGTRSRLDLINDMIRGTQEEIQTTRAPYLAEKAALTDAATLARQEAQRNEMLMQAAMRRAVDAGIDPRQVMQSPETFVRAMAPERGYGTKNWIRQEVPSINPIVEQGINTKGQLMPAVAAHEATAPKAQQIAGSTVMQPSGIYTPAGRGQEATSARSTLSNIEQTFLRSADESKRAQEALSALPKPEPIRAEQTLTELERKRITDELKLQEQMAQAAKAKGMQPGVLERIGMMLSGPKTSAALGSLGALDLIKAVEYAKQEEYKKALLMSMGALGGAALAAPNPFVKAAALPLIGIPAAYEYGPKAVDLVKRGYDYVFPPPKTSPE